MTSFLPCLPLKKHLRALSTLVIAIVLAGHTGTKAQHINIPNKTGPMGLQVNTLTGNLYFSRTDLVIPARGIDLDITFHYNSFNFDQNAGYGRGWSFGYNIRYRDDSAGAKTVTWGDGREDTYQPAGGGSFTSPRGFFNTLEQYQPGKYRITETDGTAYFFDNSIHKRITRMEEANGNFINFSYTDTLLTGMSNGNGQSIGFSYTNGRLISITDALTALTRTISFFYNTAGDLVEVKNPLNHSNKYDYLVNGPMKSIIDRNNNKIDIIYYNNFSVSELIGCNKRLSFSYDTATLSTTVTDYLTTGSNQVTKYQFKKQEDKKWLSGLTGNCCGFDTKFEYDEAGNKIKETDAKGLVTTFTYDNRGNLLTMTDPLNQTVTYTYTPTLNRVASFTDEKGFTTSMTYDAKGNLTQLTEPGNLTYTAVYAANGDILSSTDPKGNTFNYHYDSYGNPVNVTGPNGFNVQLAFNARGDLLSMTDARGHTTSVETDILGRLKKITDPLNQTIRASYDAENNPVSLQNENNETQSLAFDASNRLVEMTDPVGGKTNLTYDGMNNLRSISNAMGKTVLMEYDNRNRITKITDPEGNMLNAAYDPNGNISSVQLPNGQAYNYQYDALNRIVSASDASGQVISLLYDKNSNITSMTYGSGAVYSATYDSLNRVKQITDPLNETYSLAYDRNGNVVSVKDRNGSTSTYTYDSLNRVKTATNNNGHTLSVGYDAQGNMIALTDQNNNITTYTYDSLNRVKRTTFPDGRYTENTYDSKSNIIARRITDGSTIAFTYDSLNRVVSKTLPDGHTFSYTYDGLGRLLTATNNAGTVTFAYDALNRLVSETFGGRTVRYAYNVSGKTRTIVYPDSTVITYSYDTRDRLTSIAKNNTVLVSYQYNTANQVTAKNMANGLQTTYQYDFANRLSSITTGGGILQNSQFTYNQERQKTAINRLNDPSRSEQFTYDNGHRLINYKRGVIGGSPVLQNTYSYDALGNRTSANLNGVITNYTSNNLNQLTGSNNGAQNTSFLYDNNGNLTYDGQFYKSYDAEKRLLRDSSSPVNVITYQYDALNRRTRKVLNGTVLNYTFSGISPIEERDQSGNTILNKTFFAGWLSPLMNEHNNNQYFYHQNEMNSVEAITDQQGRLVEKYAYDVYGKMSRFDSLNNPLGGSLAGNRFGFTGQEYDSATARYKFFFREYNPETGVFSQRDLIGYADGMGMYQYVHNDPANGVDVLGLDEGGMSLADYTGNTVGNANSISPLLSEIPTSQPYIATSIEKGGKFLRVAEFPLEIGPQGKLYNGSLKLLNSPLLGLILTPINIAGTIKSYNTLKDPCATDGQRVDASIGTFSGGLNSLMGLYAWGRFMYYGAQAAYGTNVILGCLGMKGGLGITMYRGAASLGIGTYQGLQAAGTSFGSFSGGTAVAGAGLGGILTALAGGLAIEGAVNFGWQLGTGQSISESAEQDWFDFPGLSSLRKGVEWYYGEHTADFGDKAARRNQLFSGRLQDWEKARARVESNYTTRSQRNWNARDYFTRKPDCPQNNAGGTQRPARLFDWISYLVEVLTSSDPNEIIGPDGVPDKSWVSINDRLPYTVTYENDTSASAPAKYVKIVVPVDPKMDPASFQLGSFGFNSLTFSMPPATASNYQRLDCRDSLGLWVDVISGYDVSNHQFFWEFQSLDPATLLPPADPLKGFLLLQDSTNPAHGHGFVSFSVKPVRTAVTRDSILARADIIFDANDTIPTNIEKNTIDALPPTSQLGNLPANSTNPLTLHWSGNDDVNGCGLHFYTLYISNDGTNFSILKDRMLRTDTTLTLSPNIRYYFFVLATDSVGNRETLRPDAIRNTFVGVTLPVTWLYFRGTNRDKDNVLEWATGSEQQTREFRVERSFDGNVFSQIGTVPAAGNSASTRTYQFTDRRVDLLGRPVMFYRLKQLDIDNRFTYSNIIRLTYNAGATLHSIIYPNPTRDQVTIIAGDKSLLGTQAALFDEYGNRLQTFVIAANSQTLNLASYPGGIYLVRLSNNEVLRIVKQ